jgi:hypothetical protein
MKHSPLQQLLHMPSFSPSLLFGRIFCPGSEPVIILFVPTARHFNCSFEKKKGWKQKVLKIHTNKKN